MPLSRIAGSFGPFRAADTSIRARNHFNNQVGGKTYKSFRDKSSGYLSITAKQQKQANKPQRTATLHLFRALLRQCTYLPDPVARAYLHSHVVSRFRKGRKPDTLSRHSVDVHHPQQTPPSYLKAARKALLYLQRANAGHVQQLTKILEMTYGRVGKRRHELLQVLKAPSSSRYAANGVNATNCHPPQPSKDVSEIRPQFAALLRSQSTRKETPLSRQPIKRLHPVIPEKNAWGRPMPLRRVRNIKKRWYAESLDRTMPPLPPKEWDRLRRLASGEEHWDGLVPRRKGRNEGQEEEEEEDNDELGKRPHMTHRRGMSRPHALTPRFMRRLWGKILAECPTIQPNEAKQDGWDVLWADVQRERDVGMRPTTTRDMTIFAGVDPRGKILR